MDGSVQMVDVGSKEATVRCAVVRGLLRILPAHREALDSHPKGDALMIAQIAGIQGGKRCSELIPLCHPIFLTSLDVDVELTDEGIQIEAVAATEAQTGVEMEAYTAVVVAGITLIDLLKSTDPDLELTDVHLVEKTGGKADYRKAQP